MKRLLSALLLASLLLIGFTACAEKEDTGDSIDVAYLTGSTGLGMAKLIDDNSLNPLYDFEGHDGPAMLKNKLLADTDIEIAALPTNLAAQIYKLTNGAYRVVALNTLGVLYLATTGEPITELTQLIGKTVYVPDAAPEAILKHVLIKNGIHIKTDDTDTTPGVTLSRKYTLDTIQSEYLRPGTSVEIVLLPEPKLTVIEKAHSETLHLLDITAEWNKVSEQKLVQGCIVASKDFIENREDQLKAFLTAYEASILFMENPDNLDAAATIASKDGIKILPKKAVALSAIPRCHITYIDGAEMKETLSAYLEALFETAPATIGNQLPDDTFYYVAD